VVSERTCHHCHVILGIGPIAWFLGTVQDSAWCPLNVFMSLVNTHSKSRKTLHYSCGLILSLLLILLYAVKFIFSIFFSSTGVVVIRAWSLLFIYFSVFSPSNLCHMLFYQNKIKNKIQTTLFCRFLSNANFQK
jgi:hypothetical protein